ncbi:unnamed protein product [Ranitomeya imitator]|uniref:Ig-like domain-containing protein n=1 Tax=Ranitomeya imitator TaxID=111125 RepID=A0ABN9L616_9NEOB|nr:unnamed protein product [Ranitomeya imitator]
MDSGNIFELEATGGGKSLDVRFVGQGRIESYSEAADFRLAREAHISQMMPDLNSHQVSLKAKGRAQAITVNLLNRGKVLGGLPDVVTIMESKTLSLTCTVFGNPDPEVTWLKNDRDLEKSDHYSYSLEQGKFASLTIKDVSSEDSGKYGINVKNKYGGETVDVTVSVYKLGEDVPEVKPGQLPKPTPSPAPAPAPAKAPAPAPEKSKSASKVGKSGRK